MADDVERANTLDPEFMRKVGRAVESADDDNFIVDFPEFGPSTSTPDLGETSTPISPYEPLKYKRKKTGKKVQQKKT